MAALINKWRYYPEGVPDKLNDYHFKDKEVGDVGIIEARTEDNKLFKVFFIKELDYVMKIMASWIKTDGLED